MADFPKIGYQGYLYVTYQQTNFLYPFRFLYSNLEDIKKAAFDTMTYLNINSPVISIVFPLEFKKILPLKQQYWENSSVSYNEADRIRSFSSPLKAPFLYELLVTPSRISGKQILQTAACLPISVDGKNIENFLLHSDFPVDPEAKEAALYSLGEPFSWDIANDKKGPVKAVSNLELAN